MRGGPGVPPVSASRRRSTPARVLPRRRRQQQHDDDDDHQDHCHDRDPDHGADHAPGGHHDSRDRRRVGGGASTGGERRWRNPARNWSSADRRARHAAAILAIAMGAALIIAARTRFLRRVGRRACGPRRGAGGTDADRRVRRSVEEAVAVELGEQLDEGGGTGEHGVGVVVAEFASPLSTMVWRAARNRSMAA